MVCVDKYLSEIPSIPFVEKDNLVHFIFRGDAESISIPSDANDWSISDFYMKRIDGTNFWYFSRRFEPDARIDYKFVINGVHWMLDPLNPRRIEGGYGENSELRMPKYVSPPEIEYDDCIHHGSISEIDFKSEVFGNSRKVLVYTPYDYNRSDEFYPVVIFHDGLEFLSLGRVKNILDYLIARGKIVPLVGVFVPPIDRNAEYAGAQMNSFYTMIVEELLPYIDKNYRTKKQPQDRASIGASSGGNASLWLGLQYPETFGNIAALSSNVVSTVMGGYENSPRLNIKFYLDIGTYDMEQLIPLVHNFVALICAKGYNYMYKKYNEGHSWGNWRAHLGKVLEFFFPGANRSGSKKLRHHLKVERNIIKYLTGKLK
jgi:enterochelin esterase family protein